MKRIYTICALASCFLYTMLSQSAVAQPYPQLTELQHHPYGGRAWEIASKIGAQYDTAFVYAGLQVHAYQIDHASPENPVELNHLALFAPNSYNRNITVSPKNSLLLFILGGQLLIRDYITGIDHPIPQGNSGTQQLTDVVFNNDGTKAFLSNYDGTLTVIDLADPANASVINTIGFPDYNINALAFRGTGGIDTLFIAGRGYKGLRVLNVTDPLNISYIATSMAGDSLENLWLNFLDVDVATINNTIYVIEENAGIRSFPRTNINSAGDLTPLSYYPRSISPVKSGAYLIISSNNIGGMQVLNTATNQIAIHSTGSPIQEVAEGGGNLLYTAKDMDGFQIYDISNPMTPVKRGNGIFTGDLVEGIACDDRNYAYVSQGIGGIHIFDISNNYEINTFVPRDRQHYRLAVKDNILYADGYNLIDVVDIHDPGAPGFLSTYGGLNGIRDMEIVDSLVVVADYSGIKILNAKNSRNLTLYCPPIEIPGGCEDIEIVEIGDQPYIIGAPGQGNLGIWTISNPSVLTDITSGIQGGSNRCTASGSYAYLMVGDWLRMLNIANPYDIQDMGDIYQNLYGGVNCMEMAGSHIFIGSHGDRLMILDVADPANPVLKVDLALHSAPVGIELCGFNLLIAAGEDGFYHFDNPYGAARIMLENASGIRRDTVTVPVYLGDNVGSYNVSSFEMNVTFDTSFVKFIDMMRGSVLPGESDTIEHYVKFADSPSQPCTLKMAGTIPSGITSEGELFRMRYQIGESAPISPLPRFTLLKTSHIALNEGFPLAQANIARIGAFPLFGDVNNSGNLSPIDAVFILRNVIGMPGYSTLSSEVADVSYNGQIRAYDASLILKRILFSEYRFPVEDIFGLNPLIKAGTAPANPDVAVYIDSDRNEKNIGDNDSQTNKIVRYTIRLKNISSFSAAEFVIDFGAGQKFMQYRLPESMNSFSVAYRCENSRLLLSMACGEPVSRDGEILYIDAMIENENIVKPLSLLQFVLDENTISNISQSPVSIPREFRLEQNYPNPFNPATSITYQIPAAAHVSLIVYNILGQKVRTLIDEMRPAGIYTIIWDGTNDAGRFLSSGVYIYKLKTDTNVNTKKMLFIK